MRAKVAIVVLTALVLATAAAAKDKVFTDSKDYLQVGTAMKLNEGAYDKMIEVKSGFWVWCKTGYDPVTDAELSPVAVGNTAVSAFLPPEARTQQSDIAKRALMHFLPEEKFAIKETGGKHRMDVVIVRDDLAPVQGGMLCDYAAETRITDEAGNVLFRAVLHIWDYSWQAAPNKWAKDLAKLTVKNEKAFAKGYGVHPEVPQVAAPATPPKRSGEPGV